MTTAPVYCLATHPEHEAVQCRLLNNGHTSHYGHPLAHRDWLLLARRPRRKSAMTAASLFKVPIEKYTERQMLDLLNLRYAAVSPGNGARFARAEHVRSHAGFDATRTADYVAMDLWPSTGLPLHGHEVKVSRSDWLTELKHPEKAEQFKQFMDYWWLVVSDPGIVRDDLPPGWGLMVRKGLRLQVVRSAPRLSPALIPRTFLACLLRAVAKTSGKAS